MFNSSNGSGYSLSDIAAVTEGGNLGFGNGSNSWWIIILFLFVLGGWGNGFGWGGNGTNSASLQGALTRGDLCQDMNFSKLTDAVSAVRQHQYDNFYQLGNQMSNIQMNVSDQFDNVNRGITDLGYATQAGVNSINLSGLQNTYAITNQMNTNAAATAAGFNDVVTQVNRNFCDTNYNMATQANAAMVANANNTRDIIDNQNENTRSILDFLTQDKISTLENENQALKFAASQANQNSYLIDRLRPTAEPAYIVANPYTGMPYYGCNCSNM